MTVQTMEVILMPILKTERLLLIPFSYFLVKAAIKSRKRLGEMLSVHVSDEFPQPDFAKILPRVADQIKQNPLLGEWRRFIIHSDDQKIIGNIGFKQTPGDNGAIDLGYSIIPSYRGQGYSHEAAKALINWAFDQPNVKLITARCLIDNYPSIKVLEKLGMRRLEVIDNNYLFWGLNGIENNQLDVKLKDNDSAGVPKWRLL
jgi:ribosomal-protein-alanine N-acetyltransferase